MKLTSQIRRNPDHERSLKRAYLLLAILDQQAGNVSMLRRVSNEQIEISHRAAEHVR
jgi:hypothetical protein